MRTAFVTIGRSLHGIIWGVFLTTLLAVPVVAGPSSAATYDATGIWEYSTSNHWSDSWDCLESPQSGFTAITQIGETFTYINPTGIHTGRIDGAAYSSTIIYAEDYGLTIEMMEFTLRSDDRADGGYVWYWTDGFYECSGGGDISLRRLPGAATYDATGAWDYIQDENVWNDCGLASARSEGSVAITQNGDRFRFADDTGVYAGLLSGDAYISFVALFDDEGVTFNSVLLTLDTPNAGSGVVDWYWTDGWDECWGYDLLTLTRAPASNRPPDAPELSYPAPNAIDVSLQPTLRTEGFRDPDGADRHARTEWQVSTDTSFSSVVLSTTSELHLTALPVPPFVLGEGGTYYWRARFYDDQFAASPWSAAFRFTTRSDGMDRNGNGIPDFQEVSGFVDLDGDGTSDTEQDHMKVVSTEIGGGQMGVSIRDAKGVLSLGSVESIDPARISSLARPSSMPLGLFGMELTVTNPIDTAEVTVYFSEPAPEGVQWLVYDATKGWLVFDERKAEFSSDRRSVRLRIKDWGFGDSDGLPNGRIVDPGGFGVASWITGSVFDAKTGKPVPGASVAIRDLELPCSSDGTFASVILPGAYTATASAPGYASVSHGSVEVSEGGVQIISFSLDPGENIQIDLKVNGGDTPGSLPAGTPLSFDLSLAPGASAGTDADWWMVASTPWGLYSLHLSPLGWQPWSLDQEPTVQMPLVALSGVSLAGLPGLPVVPGSYIFYFGIDTPMNGMLDGEIVYDAVPLTMTGP